MRSGVLKDLMIPTTKNMSIMMPSAEKQHSEKYNPFPGGLVYIESIIDEVSFHVKIWKTFVMFAL